MQNNSFLFPQANLLASNALLFNSFDPLNLLSSISQKRVLEPSYEDIYEDLQPVKRQLKSDYSFNTIKKVEQAPILIDDEENDVAFTPSVNFANNAGIENLLQLTLLNTYLEQIQQAKEVQNRYNELMSNLVKDLVPLEKKDSDIATNYSETESISKQNSPIEAKKAPVFIDLDSEDEEDIVVNSKAVEARAILQVKEASPSNEQYNISSDLLADIPALQKKDSNKTGKRVLKMAWTPEDKKIKDVEKLMKKLEEELGIKISNQERVCKLYKENGFSVKKTEEAVMEDRSKYRFELKDKRSVVSQRTKKFNL